MWLFAFIVFAISVTGCSRSDDSVRVTARAPAPAKRTSPYGAEFWQIWGDGKSEVAAYDLTVRVDGQPRRGTAIMITTQEPFSLSARVRSDQATRTAADVIPAMTLNFIRDYETGILRRKEMISAFTSLEDADGQPAGSPLKVTFSSQEWAGQVWSELLFRSGRVNQTRHSYFEGEGDSQRSLNHRRLGISEDTLPLAARRIAWPRLQLGQTYTVQVLSSLMAERSQHLPVRWAPVTLALGKERQTTTVPAGRFRTNVFSAKWETGFSRTYYVEADSPFRIVSWDTSTGERGELTGSDRMKYSELTAEGGGEEALGRLGLTRRGARMP